MIEYTVVRSRRKTMALQVQRDSSVVVRAPIRVSQQQIDNFIEDHLDWVGRAIARQRRRMELHPEPDAMQEAALKKRAHEEIPYRVKKYAERMGLSPAGIRITSARTRFGSCSTSNRLNFSWRLMDYPDEAIDYVVVHELAHIVHKNHSSKFYALIEQYMPDYKRRRELLR